MFRNETEDAQLVSHGDGVMSLVSGDLLAWLEPGSAKELHVNLRAMWGTDSRRGQSARILGRAPEWRSGLKQMRSTEGRETGRTEAGVAVEADPKDAEVAVR